MSKHTPLEVTARAATVKFLRAVSHDPVVRAADDMLEALRQAGAQIDAYLHGARPPQRDITLCKTIRAAIAKAEGKATP